MRFFIKYGLFICVLSCGLMACHDVKKKGQLTAIDSLLQDLKQQDSMQVAFDRDSIVYMIHTMRAVRDSIKLNYENDTLLPKKAKEIENHRIGLLSLQKFAKNDSTFVRLLTEERSVLHALKLDIVQGNGDRSAYEKMISTESKKVKMIQVLGTKNRNHYLIGRQFFYAHNATLTDYNRYLQSKKLSI